jgi:hypothetical protein
VGATGPVGALFIQTDSSTETYLAANPISIISTNPLYRIGTLVLPDASNGASYEFRSYGVLEYSNSPATPNDLEFYFRLTNADGVASTTTQPLIVIGTTLQPPFFMNQDWQITVQFTFWSLFCQVNATAIWSDDGPASIGTGFNLLGPAQLFSSPAPLTLDVLATHPNANLSTIFNLLTRMS